MSEKKEFKHILSSIKIGPIELKNRIVMAPMNEALCQANGEVGEPYIAYFGARAKGGTGLITTGAIMGTKLAGEFPAGRNPHLYHQGHMHGMNDLTDRVHYFGSRIAAQMTIGFGRQGHSYDHHKLAPAATAGLPYEIAAEKTPNHLSDLYAVIEYSRYYMTGQMTREMSIEEIRSEQKEFANSCQLAVICGFDAIEIHAPHGYLEHQFLSLLSNKRSDMYGGEWRNRKRFLMEVAEQIRYACPGIAVGCRISAEEHMQGGLTEEEMIDVAKDLEAIGLDYISLSDGAGYEESGHLITDMDRSRHIPEHGEAFKKALKIPVMVSSQHDPVKIEKNIAEGKYDLQAMGRQMYCDPEYVNKLAAEKAKEIVRCTRCNTCLMRFLTALTPACPQNPNLGREYALDEYKIGPWQKHESIIPEGALRAPMPSLDRPWWKNELSYIEKSWRPLQGRTKR
ncbi:oxidoreductase [Desulfosudis oleivorans]|uniref:NADH:flavin oxidoreductase/NADH oxidase n=1 Tax=Desulfosudis oleivorans (strain DSM 6200 / JCM 39069 / Hxd3) TaxID=96561 RepID=A9A010_DESOH|nr:NADH:flavin oxidoreductase [Desulfosudis oleivorans]ABW67410.1 NADH:flavin oxidoreductase/NADH oxidase [Desulfosudis oleivorans Hxd3]